MTLRGVRLAALLAALATCTLAAPAQADKPAQPDPQRPVDGDSFHLPPVPADDMRIVPPQPSWDTGLLLAPCGAGKERPWETTKFCLGALADVVFLRQKEDETGVGGYAQLATAGFRDLRGSVGFTSIFSLVDWFSLTARGGGLAVVGQGGAQPGLEGYLEFGHRSVSLESRYALSHGLLTGMQYALPAGDRPSESVIWIGLRLDAVWLTAPVALFK